MYYLLQRRYIALDTWRYSTPAHWCFRFHHGFQESPGLNSELPIQEQIAAILSAYDELIENNKRRIALLEKLAEEIYREWFVRLRFPGHEKMKIVKACRKAGNWSKLEQSIRHSQWR